MPMRTAWPIAILLAATACGTPPERKAPDREETADAAPAPERSTAPESSPAAIAAAPISAAPIPAEPGAFRSCAAELGTAAAARRVAICRDVSPATHPPCNAANSCAAIEDEIARACALFDGNAPPMKGCPPAPNGPAAAAAVVRRYYSAIDAHDYGTAWQEWGDDGRPGQSFAAFQKGFANTRNVRVTIAALPPGDGGAGSLYQPVPVTVDATLDDGTHQRFRGTYVLRRVNDVDGATPGQLRWHIDSAKLSPVAAD